ncbi:MAG: aminotransferase class V-fold PLP-dependent enzyme [Bacteriovoracaceae bacterium]|nr:aminotransferase class V-fold PLP-dependent enzyme [Bacteriovoracaceae bacterium]
MYEVGDGELKAIERVLNSQKYFRYQGPDVETETSLCELEWAQRLGSEFTLLTTSGTNSLVAGMAAFGIGVGDEVIIPAYTFVATAAAVMQVGAIPIVANIDESLLLNPEEVKKCITDKTKAVVAVHMDGLVCDLDGLKKVCGENNLLLVEDAAQACGASYKGQAVGTIGAFGGFSFNVDKVLSCGEGGLLVIADKSYQEQIKRSFLTHDTPAQFGASMREELAPLSFMGLSMRMNEINSAMLRIQMTRLDHIIEKLRGRKKQMADLLRSEGYFLRMGHDPEGDNGSVVHVVSADPLENSARVKSLLASEVVALSPTMRPAHAAWQWFKGMDKSDYWAKGLNPYGLTEKSYVYEKSSFLPSIQFLGSTIRIPIPYEGDFNNFLQKVLKGLKG